MKFMPLILVASLFLLTACQESSKKKSSSSSSNPYCVGTGYYTVPGCPGYTGTTTGGTTGTSAICSQGNNYFYYPGCPGFCQTYPTNSACTTTTTGGTTGGTTNPYPQYPSTGVDVNWGVKYPGGIPTGNCSAAYAPSGIGFTPYETRVATITAAGHVNYNPSTGQTLYNTSDLLKTVTGARTFLETDSQLKIRFKAKPQPVSNQSTQTCFGRVTGQASTAGYTKLIFSVSVVGIKADGSTGTDPVTVVSDLGVNSCSTGYNLSSFASKYPGGMYLRIDDVFANQNCFEDAMGFANCNAYKIVRAADCWSLDIEVAADGTKTFD